MNFALFVPMFKLVTPSGASFDPRGIMLIILVEIHKEIIYTKY